MILLSPLQHERLSCARCFFGVHPRAAGLGHGGAVNAHPTISTAVTALTLQRRTVPTTGGGAAAATHNPFDASATTAAIASRPATSWPSSGAAAAEAVAVRPASRGRGCGVRRAPGLPPAGSAERGERRPRLKKSRPLASLSMSPCLAHGGLPTTRSRLFTHASECIACASVSARGAVPHM